MYREIIPATFYPKTIIHYAYMGGSEEYCMVYISITVLYYNILLTVKTKNNTLYF